jgi:hypothetical protein
MDEWRYGPPPRFSFTSRPFYSPWRSLQYLLDNLGGARPRPEEKDLYLFRESNPEVMGVQPISEHSEHNILCLWQAVESYRVVRC